MLFSDREDAGKQLAQLLLPLTVEKPLVLAIPRGGVIVGYEIARALHAPLDIIIPRKVGAPFNPELAVGAVMPDGEVLYNEELLARLRLTPAQLQPQVDREYQEVQRRMEAYRGQKPLPVLEDRVVILVDDGIATGFTVLAALRALRRHQPRRLVLAVPVAPEEALETMRQEVDQVFCLAAPEFFVSVSQFYARFEQNVDAEVIARLQYNPPASGA